MTVRLVAIVIILSLYTTKVCTANELHVSTKECPQNVNSCYNFSRFVKEISHFGSNTTVVFLSGVHQVNATGHTVIANVDNFTLAGSDSAPTVIQCIGRFGFGFGFVNITNLMVKSIQFVRCGAGMSKKILQQIQFTNIMYVYGIIYNFITNAFKYPALYLIQVMEATILKVQVHKSIGTGLVGLNVLGNSSISQSTLMNNNPNCAFMFNNKVSMLNISEKNILMINDSEFTLGTSSLPLAAGTTFVWAQTKFFSLLQFSNVTIRNNTGRRSGNMLLEIGVLSYRLVEIKLNELNCSHGQGDTAGLSLDYTLGQTGKINVRTKHTTQISNSFFGWNNAAIDGAVITIWAYYEGAITTLTNTTICNNKATGINFFTPFNISPWTTIVLESVRFFHNEAALLAFNAIIILKGNGSFHQNYVKIAPVTIRKTTMIFNGNITFTGNVGSKAGAIYAFDGCCLVFNKNTTFLENEGYNGGAVALYGQSLMDIGKNSTIHFIRNHASHYGGALYVDDPTDYSSLVNSLFMIKTFFKCFYKYESGDRSFDLLLKDNQADYSGSAIYGGLIDLCLGNGKRSIDTIFHINRSNPEDFSTISSDPTRICICSGSIPDYNTTEFNVTVYPGQIFQIFAIGVGQRQGTVPATVYSHILQRADSDTQPTLEILQYTQETGTACTNLSYTVRSPNKDETMILTTEKLSYIHMNQMIELNPSHVTRFDVNIELLACPLGFILDDGTNSCNCVHELQRHKIPCYINIQRIYREKTFWINATHSNETVGVLVHKHCPFDYCKPQSLNISLENPDEQCAFQRSGTLCGACKYNLSHVLGSSNCKQCSNFHLFLIPAFALAGMALVFFLMLLNLTVSSGTINGLIFYANVVRANQAVFFPPNTSRYFYCSHFIAGINLDFGIETCFYNGMDGYAKTWLQFLFPLYIWFIVILIIVSSHYFTTAAKLAGRNAVQVLATLFLLSYAKLLRLTITIFSSSILKYPDGSFRRVWLYDGNVDYLKGKHVPLFMSAMLVLLALSIPFTTVLLFIRCLQLKSKYRVLFWIGKFKPLFDAYTGPYKDKHRHWTGLLLSIRVILFVIASVNTLGIPSINLLATAIITACLFVYTFLFGGIYKTWYLNALECSYFFNLSVLSSATLYTRLTSGNQAAVIHTSVAIAFATFVLTVKSHAIHRIITLCKPEYRAKEKIASCMKRLKLKFMKIKPPRLNNAQHSFPAQNQRVPVTFIELREPLLEGNS